MYCGAAMPEPAAAPAVPAPRKELPKDLDQAFQRAMLHGDMRQLRAVLGGVEARPTVITPEPVGAAEIDKATKPSAGPAVAPEPPASAEGVQEIPIAALEPLPEPVVTPGELYARLSEALVQAGGWEDDPSAAVQTLHGARETLDQLVQALGGLDGPPELVLPPFRQPWALFVLPPGDPERLHEVARALGIDLATARQVAVQTHPRAALRSADRADLEGRAARYRPVLGLPAAVLDEAALRAQPAARLVLSLAAEGPWRSAVSASWEPDSSAISGLSARDDAPFALRLVVVGEVVVTRYRELRGRRRDEGRLSSHGDRRVAVLDLHHAAGVLRVVDGVTQLAGWAGLDPRRTALAFRGLPEALAARYPTVPVLGRCVCRPTRQPEARDDGRMEAAGWPAWEEHSRACRVLFVG